MGERGIRNLNAQGHEIADKSKRAISDQRAWKKAGFAQDLKTVTCSQHKLARARVANHCFHDRREASDRAAAQIVAVGKTARQNNRIVIAQRSLFVPNVIGLEPFDTVNSRDAILVAIGTGKLDDGELHVEWAMLRARCSS